MPNFLNESMTLKGNFWRGGGFNLKNLPWEGYGYFLEQHIFILCGSGQFSCCNLLLLVDNFNHSCDQRNNLIWKQ